MSASAKREYRPETRLVQSGTLRSPFGETSEALFLTQGYVYDTAAQAEARFKGEDPGYQYSRFANPTVDMFERRMAAFEGAEAARATATGMAAKRSRAHYKNFQGLLNAYSKWNGRSAMKLLVVGPLWTSEEGRLLSGLGISRLVELLTDVRDEALCTLYNQAKAFIYPSLYEGFGIPLLEAMACGCPVIASRYPTTVEIAGDCCIYFELDSPDSLIDAFDRAVSEGRDGAKARAGLEHAKRFSWEKTARETLAVYRSLLQEGVR